MTEPKPASTVEQAMCAAMLAVVKRHGSIHSWRGPEVLAALDAAGWQVVPVVATEGMRSAGEPFCGQEHDAGIAWEAMLAAARRG